jgi:hypothetical protein
LSVELKLFCAETVEHCVNNCFKWFSNVLLRLKPNSRVFSTNSLFRYNTTFLLLLILHSHPSACGGTFNVISLVLRIKQDVFFCRL